MAKAHILRRSARSLGIVCGGRVLAAAVLLGVAFAQLSAPQNVTVSSTAPDQLKWVNGVVDITWDAVASNALAGYNVTVAPLAYMETFEPSSGNAADTTLQDFVQSPGKSTNAIGIVNNALQLDFDDASWANATMGVMASPAAFRRLPESIASPATITYMTVDVDCSGAPPSNGTVQCGIIVYNAGSRMPLLFWGLRRVGSAGPWYVVLDGQLGGANVQTVANTANAAWNPAAVTLYIERRSPTDTSNPFTVAAKLKGDTTAWANVKARVVVSISQLDAFSTGALWFGVTGKAAFTPLPPGNSVAYRSAAGVRGSARFDNLFVAMTLPTSALKDLYGFTDTCLAPGVTIPRAVSVLNYGATNTSARVTGLSANFPYMVLVQAISAATGQLSAPAPPLEGTFFWARRMPPRQQKLALWLDAKWLPAGAVSTWSDASGNGHHVINTGAAAQKPVAVHANNGYGYDFINPGHVTFTRTSSQYLVGDADSIHFGVSKPMTVYWFAINRYSSTQVVMGRGAMATKLDTSSSGWVLGVSSTSSDTATGFASMRVGAASPTAGSSGAASVVAASQTRGWILNYGYQLMSPYIVGVSRVLLKNGSAVPSNADAMALANAGLLPADYNATRYPITGSGSLLRTYACNTPACNTGTELPFFDERNPDFNNTYLSDPYQVTYVDTGAANGNLQAVPTVSSDLNFRIGGVPYSINTATAYGGDVFSVMVYNEDHDIATRNQVVQSTIDRFENNYCPLAIHSPGLNPGYDTDQCRTGPIWADCYQDCKSGYYGFLGWSRYHSCVNGYWNVPPLVCKRMCYDVLAPLYYSTCYRRYIEESFNVTGEPWLEAKYWVSPVIPIVERLRIWVWDKENQWMTANTKTTSNACDRIRNQWLLYGPNNARWNSFSPPNNNLPQWTRADILIEDELSLAGVATRTLDQNNHYRVEFNTRNATVVRMVSNVRTVIGAFKLNATIPPGTWFNAGIRATNKVIDVTMDNTTVFSVTEPANYVQWGPGALWIGAGSAARFDNLTIDVGCDIGGVARYMYEGMRVDFTCKYGYDVIGNTTWNCNDNVKQYGGAYLICKSQPPVPTPPEIKVLERTQNNTFIGNTLALPANAEQVISYEIVKQYPPGPGNRMAFSISGCSGSLRVFDPPQLDYNKNPNITLTIFAWPDTQRISGVYYNQTVQLIDIPDPPAMEDQSVSVPEGGCGLAFWNFTLPVSNPDGFKLTFIIKDGNPAGLFALNSTTGQLTVSCTGHRCPSPISPAECPTGLNWAYASSHTIVVTVLAPDGSGGSANIFLSVIDVNTPPVAPAGSNTLQAQEIFIVPGRPLGSLTATDTDAANPVNPLSWSTLSYGMVSNARWVSPFNTSKIFYNLLNITSDGYVALSSEVPDAGLPYGDYVWYQRRLVRGVLTATFSVSDAGTPPLTNTGTVTVVITAMNSTDDWPTVTDIQLPQGGLLTSGGQLIVLSGSNMPANSPMDLRYYTPDGILRVGDRCVIASDTTASCRAPPGFGYGLPFNLTLGNRLPNYTIPLEVSYAPPRVDTVTITDRAYTTAGSALNGVMVTGANFGPPGTPVTIKIGNNAEFDAVPTTVDHLSINATLGPGCGTNLPVTVIVGGQNSSVAWLIATGAVADPSAVQFQQSSPTNANTPTISYPRASIDGFYIPPNAGYGITSLATLGGQYLRLRGINFGPSAIRRVSRKVYVTYHDASGVYLYSTQCTPLAASPHTDVECQTQPGVGAGHIFVADICGQTSTPSAFNASYAAPTLIDITGPGAFRASTEGGQKIVLRGSEFGPVQRLGDLPFSINSVTYARPGADQAVYSAVECVVSSATSAAGALSEITCLTAPGTGTGHGWTAVVGGQMSNTLNKGTGYSPPIVSYFTGVGAVDADTRGSQLVTVNGQNFGAWPDRIAVMYIDKVSIPRATDNLVPHSAGQPAGIVRYEPASCTLSVAHRALDCLLSPGAGESLTWKLTVDGQESTDPTTSFARPIITDVRYAVAGVFFASADGGDVVVISGSGFGLDFLQQSVTYGPSGKEYAVKAWQYVSHTTLRATLVAGVGANLSFVITVADQVSQPFMSGISYATPIITSITPASAGTMVDASRPTVVTVRGFDFGLINANVEVEVAFGNDADNSVLRLPISSRSPTQTEVNDPTWRPAVVPTPQMVTFYLPESLGANRTIRLIQYLRGKRITDSQVRSLAPQLQEPWRAQFSYEPPYLSYIIVRAIADEDTCATMQAAFGAAAQSAGIAFIPSSLANPAGSGDGTGNGDAAATASVNCSSSRQIDIVGFNMGPPQTLHNDGIQRLLQYLDPSSSDSNAWLPRPVGWETMPQFNNLTGSYNSNSLSRVVIANHTHSRISAFTTMTAGTLRLALVSSTWTGSLVTQASNTLPFAETSPAVSGLQGQPPGGYSAEGWEKRRLEGLLPETITITVSQLLQFTTLRIMVGDSLTAAQCPIVDSVGNRVPDNEVYARLVQPVTNGGAGAVQLTCWVPEGQGRQQPVVVVRDQTTSNTDVTADYAPPAILGIGALPPLQGTARSLAVAEGVVAFPTGARLVTVPTSLGRVRFQVSNAGPCPTLRVTNGAGNTFIPACSFVPDPYFGRVRVFNPDVAVSFDPFLRSYVVDFNVTEGEGTGVSTFNPLGWTLVLESGNQDTTITGGVVLLRYEPPTVTSINPESGPTSGSTAAEPFFLTINGTNFGTGLAAGISIVLASPLRVGTLTCGSVRYVSHSRLQCALPPGTGYFFRARVRIADQVGEGGLFNYSAPVVQRITLLDPTLVMTASAANASGILSSSVVLVNGTSNVTVSMAKPLGVAAMTPLLWSTLSVAGPDSAAKGTIGPSATLGATLPVASGSASRFDATSGLSLLEWPTTGTAVVVIDGANFGVASADNCAVVSPREVVPPGVPGVAVDTTAPDSPVVCNGLADFLAEGEVPASSVLFWNHTRVVFALPPGAGYRTITVAPGGQPPSPASAVGPTRFNLRYADPKLRLPLVRRSGKVSTDGGDLIEIIGRSLPYPPTALVGATINTAAVTSNGTGGNSSVTAMVSSVFPFQLPPPDWTMLPTENVRISFNNFSANGSCLGSPYTALGAGSAPGFERCSSLGVLNAQLPAGSSLNPYTNAEYRRILLAQQLQSTALGSTAAENAYGVFLANYNTNGTEAPVDVLTFRAPPGVGVNKTLVVEVVDRFGNVVAASEVVLFSYDPPIITSVQSTDSRIVYDDGKGGQAIRILGKNMGRFRDIANYTEEERILSVNIGGWLSVNASRQESLTGSSTDSAFIDFIGFTLPPASPVGFSEVTVRVAGQYATSDPRSAASLFVGCKRGYFAHSNETCSACPIGAWCNGTAGAMLTTASGTTELDSINFRSLVPVPHPYLLDPLDRTQHLDLRRLINGTIMVGNLEVDLLGYHTYPIPAAGFFDLNSTMASACPPLVRSYFPDRDVCVVACIPATACNGANICSEAYRSKAPYYRCSDCNVGYFKSAGDCIKCPDSPYMLFVGAGMIIIVIATIGYLLNKYQYDIRVVSIGIDYFQVLAIFANAKVAWPPIIKELYRMLSAFNLNIEIVAPECLIPDVSFTNKYFIIIALPSAVLISFLTLNGLRFLWARYIKKQNNWRDHLRTMASSISILLLLMFLLYLYVTRTVLSVFQCVAATPDDGKTYMVEVFEECGKSGGVQMTLVPWSVASILVMVVGYPVAVLTTLVRNRESVMEDQLLRALDIHPPKGSWLVTLRAMMGRTYNQFKPQFFFWIVFIITRKFLIAFSGLMFSRNPAFQMAFCLLVLFLAYALQVRYRPYMPIAEFDEVLDHAANLAKTSPLFASLRARVISVEAATKRKRGNKNTLASGGSGLNAQRVASTVITFITNFNVVESFLLFSASMVCLLAIMYQSLSVASSGVSEGYYEQTRSSVTGLLMALIIVSIIYYVAVLLLDFTAQYQARRAAYYEAEAERRLKKTGKKDGKGDGSARPERGNTGVDKFRDKKELTNEETLTNPMFMKAGGAEGPGGTGSVAKAIAAQLEPPNHTLWSVFRSQFGLMLDQVGGLSDELSRFRGKERKMVEALQVCGLMDADGNWLDAAGVAAGGHHNTRRADKRQFRPIQSVNGAEEDSAAASAGAGAGAGAGPGLRASTKLKGPARASLSGGAASKSALGSSLATFRNKAPITANPLRAPKSPAALAGSPLSSTSKSEEDSTD